MSLDGDKVISDYKKDIGNQLKLNKHLFNTKMKEYLEYIKLEKDGKKSKYFSEPTQELLYSGISDSKLKLIGIDKNTYLQEVLEELSPGDYTKSNRTPTTGGRKTKSKKSNRRNTRKHRKSRKSRKSRK